MSRFVVAAFVMAVALAPTLAGAQMQSPTQRACINFVNKAAQRVVKAEAAAASECFVAVVSGTQHPDRCATHDPDGDVADAGAALAASYVKKCGDVPDFGTVTASAAAIAAVGETVDLHRRLYPAAFDFIDGPSHFTDWSHYAHSPACAVAVHRAVAKLFASKLKAFAACARKGLAAGSVTSAAALGACVTNARSGASKKIANLVARIDRIIDAKCKGPPFEPYWYLDADVLSDCRTCGFVRGVHGLSGVCDELSFVCNETCGNGVVSPPEACDDGNFIDGDGCDRNCSVTGCGNAIVSDGEYCDLASGRCVNGAHDGLSCSANKECPGGFCTYCPSGSCAADCGACRAGTCCAFASGCAAPWDHDAPAQVCALNSFPCDDPQCMAGPTCCSFDGFCTGFDEGPCLEYEGTPVDCGACTP